MSHKCIPLIKECGLRAAAFWPGGCTAILGQACQEQILFRLSVCDRAKAALAQCDTAFDDKSRHSLLKMVAGSDASLFLSELMLKRNIGVKVVDASHVTPVNFASIMSINPLVKSILFFSSLIKYICIRKRSFNLDSWDAF
jgi:hypothetical protein